MYITNDRAFLFLAMLTYIKFLNKNPEKERLVFMTTNHYHALPRALVGPAGGLWGLVLRVVGFGL